MEFSKQQSKKTDENESDKMLQGNALVNQVVELTGLPTELIGPELETIISESGKDVKDLTLTELREVMLKYLQTLSSEFPY